MVRTTADYRITFCEYGRPYDSEIVKNQPWPLTRSVAERMINGISAEPYDVDNGWWDGTQNEGWYDFGDRDEETGIWEETVAIEKIASRLEIL